eukprot:TRINITY_DN7077_c0_g2_i4.p1 TRINITY_DN7077_c0_g2~~TRINITY_DN7077_c0_g2_i4.p1  ORF type:complete len:172 (+),score=7.98 TRINITY_DN7077_c0_g2_i4:74-589(+)
MVKVKASLWCVPQSPLPLLSVELQGRIVDYRNYNTIVQSYHTPKSHQGDLVFQLSLCDVGLVTDFSAIVGDRTVQANVKLRSEVDKSYDTFLKQNIDTSTSDSLLCRLSQVPPDTDIKLRVSWVQSLRLQGDRILYFTLPTTVSRKYYYHEQQDSDLPTIQQFNFDIKFFI